MNTKLRTDKGNVQKDSNPTQEQKTNQCHQWVFNKARQFSTQSSVSGAPYTLRYTSSTSHFTHIKTKIKKPHKTH